jgi:hypothetical protein
MINGTRSGWGVSVTPLPLFTPGKDPVPITQEAGWASGPVWTGAENLAPTALRSPDRPARSQSLYRLSVHGMNGVKLAASVFLKCVQFHSKDVLVLTARIAQKITFWAYKLCTFVKGSQLFHTYIYSIYIYIYICDNSVTTQNLWIQGL